MIEKAGLSPGMTSPSLLKASSELQGLIGISGDDVTWFLVQQLPLGSALNLCLIILLNNLESYRRLCIFYTLAESQAQLRSINSNFQLNNDAQPWQSPEAAFRKWVVRASGDVVSILKL